MYFTPASIAAKAGTYLERFASPRRGAASPLILNKSALLVLDMQEYFLDPASHAWAPSAAAIVPGLKTVLQAYHMAGRPIFFTRHLNTPQNAGMMNSWWRELLTPGDPLSAITSQLDVSAGQLIEKSQYDAFYSTRLEAALQKANIRQLVIGGVLTHLCCETTARAAFVRGFEVYFLVDGTATYNERLHVASLENLAHGFAQLLSCSDVSGQRV